MRYLGSKVKILPLIDTLIQEQNITGTTFADLFAGTGCVGDYFKNRFQIIANDFLASSYYLNKAKLKFAKTPSFSVFKDSKKMDIFYWLNKQDFVPDSSYFIYHNYTPKSGRFFFSDENGIRIDGIRQMINQLKREQLIDEVEFAYLIASLIESVTRYSNTSGTFEAFFKFWESRALKYFEIEPLEINQVDNVFDNIIYCENTNQLVRKISGDIAYIDTPYTVTQYVSAYHLLETIALYDNPNIKGVGGKRDRGDKNSLYARRTAAKEEFEDLFRQLNFKHVIVSYSNQGLVPLNELIELAKKFSINNEVVVKRYDYQEYQNHRSSNKKNGEDLNEVLIYFQKDYYIRKSPLNYSGSKDVIFNIINRELPKHVGTFVDVMGGAFNVGLNVVAMDKVHYNEIEPHIFKVIEYLLSEPKSDIVESVEKCISHYGLGKAEKEAFNSLKEHYNKNKSSLELFVLHMYAFQNMIRFNKNQIFNTPIGVAGYSEDLRKRIVSFRPKTANVILSNTDYSEIIWENYPKDTLFYFDPPYFITNAAYNDGKRGGKGWGHEEENQLFTVLEKINSLGYKFILSNVIKHKGKIHTYLVEWVEKNKFTIIEAGVTGWRYEKKEVLIKNF